MCFQGTVGQGGQNQSADVVRLQLLLNLNQAVAGFAAPLSVDGGWGNNSRQALTGFRKAKGIPDSNPVAPGDATVAAFHATRPATLIQDSFWATMATAKLPTITRYYQSVAEVMKASQINTPLRISHFLAQIGHESLDLRYSEEIADGSAYEGRADLGNTQPGDGPRFKGRGLIQLTGRANYTDYGQAKGRDFLTGTNPGLIASDPDLAVDVAAWFWNRNSLNKFADADDVLTITRRINGGTNGLDDRKARLGVAKWFLV
jgi:putative chitinase